MREIEEKWLDIAPHLLMFNSSVSVDEQKKISAEIKKYYFGEKPISRKTAKELIQVN